MNYEEINTAILSGRDINDDLVTKDERFYQYLFNNKVAYFYAKHLSRHPNDKERWIVARGDELNAAYVKTLKKIVDVCGEHKIDFMVFKTHKFIPGVVDGDIDLIVSKNDFERFLILFRHHGFDCHEDEPGKGKCVKGGYLIIEPHVAVSWRGNSYSDEGVWDDALEVEENGLRLLTMNPHKESIVRLQQSLYEPGYLTLYDICHLRSYVPAIPEGFPASVASLYGKVATGVVVAAAPIFLDNLGFLRDWFIELGRQRNFKTYFLHIIFFFYWKLRYRVAKKLPFSHEWSIYA